MQKNRSCTRDRKNFYKISHNLGTIWPTAITTVSFLSRYVSYAGIISYIAQSFVSASTLVQISTILIRSECSECKIFTCGKKLAHAKKLLGWQADNLHAHAREMDFELFISAVEKRAAMRDPRDMSTRTGKRKQKSVHAKACTQKQAFKYPGSEYFLVLFWKKSELKKKKKRKKKRGRKKEGREEEGIFPSSLLFIFSFFFVSVLKILWSRVAFKPVFH